MAINLMERKLIELVERNECLWKKDHAKYGDYAERADAWAIIALTLDITENACRRKWNTLCDKYMDNLNAAEGNRQTCFDSMKFLSKCESTTDTDNIEAKPTVLPLREASVSKSSPNNAADKVKQKKKKHGFDSALEELEPILEQVPVDKRKKFAKDVVFYARHKLRKS